jgi:hypothetical protein
MFWIRAFDEKIFTLSFQIRDRCIDSWRRL